MFASFQILFREDGVSGTGAFRTTNFIFAEDMPTFAILVRYVIEK